MTRYPAELPTITRPEIPPILLDSEIASSTGSVRFFWWTVVGTSSAWIGPAADDPFERQKSAFLAIPPLMLVPFSGQWVVSVDGTIRDSDRDLQVLSKRFFDANGDIDVYIAKLGGKFT